MLTKVEQIIEREKQEAIEANTSEITRNVTKSVKEDIAKKFLKSGSTPEYVADNIGMTLEAVIELQKNL